MNTLNWLQESTFGIMNVFLYLHIIPAILFFFSPFILKSIGRKPILLVDKGDLYDKVGLFMIHIFLTIIVGIGGSGLVPVGILVGAVWGVIKLLNLYLGKKLKG